MAGTQPDFQVFLDSFWAQCAGHVRDASWPRHGRGQISGTRRQHSVQAMFGVQARSQAFWAVFGTRFAGHVQDALGNFWEMDTVGTQVDFQAHEGSNMCKPCHGRRRTKAYFHAHEGSTGSGHMKAAPSTVHMKGAGTRRRPVVHTDAHHMHTRQFLGQGG
ncbi:Hypothetical predicted protein [Olea europaea subsp. europaea]|uniref:Uncharacterized protein n=1 Tax=Olea europaea subsp. europaea TaxID=158383 RepID=A0A8S0SA13_OLEEU|nr:Hypothetical predicted protein [Olea europaea subsp. europaea]